MDLNEIVLGCLNEFVEEMKTNIVQSGKNTTGKAKDNIRIEHENGNYKVIGVPYFNTLEEGREGGKVPKGFYHIIKKWAVDKGLFGSTDRELSRFAYFTSRKIADMGTEQYRLGKRTDIYTDARNKLIEKLKTKVLQTSRINIKKLL